MIILSIVKFIVEEGSCQEIDFDSYLGLVSPLDFEYKYNQKTYENAA